MASRVTGVAGAVTVWAILDTVARAVVVTRNIASMVIHHLIRQRCSLAIRLHHNSSRQSLADLFAGFPGKPCFAVHSH